jgi:hypothetical protein
MLRRDFCLSLVAWTVLSTNVLAEESIDLVDLAGRQRMLTQRIAKSYAQVGANVLPRLSSMVLQDSMDAFSAQQVRLRSRAILPDQQKLIAVLDGQWAEVIALTNLPVDKGRAAELQTKVNAMERLFSQLTYLLRGAHSPKPGKMVTIAGRQRMLSQRITKAYMLRAWGVDIPNLRIEMAIAADEFSAGLLVLQQSPENTQDVLRELLSINSQWEWLQGAFDSEDPLSKAALIAERSEALLSDLETLTGSYSRFAAPGAALR